MDYRMLLVEEHLLSWTANPWSPRQVLGAIALPVEVQMVRASPVIAMALTMRLSKSRKTRVYPKGPRCTIKTPVKFK